MKLKFTSKSIIECSQGGFYAKNDNGSLVDAEGKPIDVHPNMIDDLLAMKHSVDGEDIPIFKLVEGDDTEEAGTEEPSTPNPEETTAGEPEESTPEAETGSETKKNSRKRS